MIVSFNMPCTECDEEVTDIEVDYIESYGREEFWGRPVQTDDSEAEIANVPACVCGHVLDEDVVLQHFWDREVP